MIGLLRRPAGPCVACGAQLPRSAVWCGSCGERIAAAGVVDEAVVTQDEGPAPAAASDDHRLPRVVAGITVLGLVAAAVGLSGRAAPGEPLTGRLGNASGASSTAPPGDDLVLAWDVALPDDVRGEMQSRFVYEMPMVEQDGLLAISGLVLDTGSGDVVADRGYGRAGRSTVLDGDRAIVVDELTGEVLARFDVPAVEDGWEPRYPIGRVGDVTVLEGRVGAEEEPVVTTMELDELGYWEEDSTYRHALVRDDGTLVALLPEGDEPIVVEHPTHLAVQRWGDRLRGLASIEAATGRVTPMQVPAGLEIWSQPVVVGDDLLVVASGSGGGPGVVRFEVDVTDGSVTDADLPGGPGWRVLRLDMLTGALLDDVTLDGDPGASDGGPLVHGLLDDRIVVSRGDRRVTVMLVGGGRPATVLVEELRPVRSQDYWLDRDRSVAMADGLAVLADGEAGTVTAWSADGIAWTKRIAGVLGVGATGGHVAVVLRSDDAERRPLLRVLRAQDGSTLTTVDGSDPMGGVSAVLDDAVLVSPYGRRDLPTSGFTPWLDRATGAAVSGDEVLAELVDEDVHGFGLLGTVLDETGVARPVLVREEDQGSYAFIGVDGARRDVTIELGTGARSSRAPGGFIESFPAYSRPIGVVGDALVFSTYTDGGEHTTVVRPDAGVTVQLDVAAYELVGSLAIGPARVDDSWDRSPTLVAYDVLAAERRWSTDVGGYGPLVGDDELVVFAGAGRMTVLDAATGEERWAIDHDRPIASGTVMTDELIVTSRWDGTVVALDRDSGQQRWVHTLADGAAAALTTAGDHVVVGTVRGVVVELDAKGRAVQRIPAPLGPAAAVADVAVVGHDVVVVAGGHVRSYRPARVVATTRDDVNLP